MAEQSPSDAKCSQVEAVKEEEQEEQLVKFPPEEEAVRSATNHPQPAIISAAIFDDGPQ